MPPKRRATPSDAKEFIASQGKVDEDQADMSLKTDEIAHVNAPEPATVLEAMGRIENQYGDTLRSPLMDDNVTEAELNVASVAGLLGDLKALHEAHNILVERLGNVEEWINPVDGPNLLTHLNSLWRRLEHAESVTDGAMVGLNERLGILELRSDATTRELSTRGATNDAPPAIYGAVWGIMRDVQGVGKHGQMDPSSRLGNYKYRRYDDLKRDLGAACRMHGVMLQSEIVNVVNDRNFEDKRKTRVQVSMRYLFTSLIDGSAVKFEVIGESIDTSDKATGKAMTMALKSALDQAFMLAMEDIEDPDATRPGEHDPDVPIHTRGPLEGQPISQEQQRREPHPTKADLAAAQQVEREYAVGDTVTVAGTTFTKHSDGPGFPNDAPRDAGNAWDQGPPPDRRTDEEKAQAAADKVNAAGTTLADWSKISDAARQMGLYEVLVKVNGQEMALKHHLVAVGRTLA